ncbi:TM2 domain-containing protein [bacterium]|nr:TM2 domain-containing protein [bacterium]
MFCKYCGAEISDQTVICPKCGGELKSDSVNNDVAANNNTINKFGNYDKTTIIIVCLFVGGLGVHNFMMGETKKGLFRLLATILGCGLGGIFALIDLIKLISDKYDVDPEKII